MFVVFVHLKFGSSDSLRLEKKRSFCGMTTSVDVPTFLHHLSMWLEFVWAHYDGPWLDTLLEKQHCLYSHYFVELAVRHKSETASAMLLGPGYQFPVCLRSAIDQRDIYAIDLFNLIWWIIFVLYVVCNIITCLRCCLRSAVSIRWGSRRSCVLFMVNCLFLLLLKHYFSILKQKEAKGIY